MSKWRQCKAHLREAEGEYVRCEILVAPFAGHTEDHKATVDGGHTIRWTDAVAVPGPEDDTDFARNTPAEEAAVGARATQVGGDHYAKHKIQHWDIVQEYGLGYFEGAIVKYVLRHRDKNGVEDLKKARHTLDRLIEIEEGK